MSQAALETGAKQMVLFTDLANPTGNALYQRLGYRPVEDRAELSFESSAPVSRTTHHTYLRASRKWRRGRRCRA